MFQRIVLLCSITLFALSCKEPQKKEKKDAPELPIVQVASRPVTLDRYYVADIQAVRNVELRSKIPGFLEEIYVDEGQHVHKGQVLFRLNDMEYKSAVEKARAIVNTTKAQEQVAQVEYERVKLLTSKNIVSHTELDLALSRLNAAKAKTEEALSDLHSAEYKLSYTTICAPFDGVVDRIPLKTGSLLSEGTLVTTESDVSTVYAYFDVSENEYLAYNKKNASGGSKFTTADLILSDGEHYKYKGKVETVVSEFDANTGSISFRATFPNPERLLRHKATGKVLLTASMDKALLIPQKSTFEIQDKSYVFVLDDSNIARMKSFQPVGRVDTYFIVGGGLKEGDRIIYEGIQDLKEGMTVKPRMMTADSAGRVAAQ